MNSKRHDERESDLPVNLANPARRALVEAGYWRLEQLTEISEAEVKQLRRALARVAQTVAKAV